MADRTERPNQSREIKFSGANGDRVKKKIHVQLTTSRIGKLTLLINTLPYGMTIHTQSKRAELTTTQSI